MKTIQKNISAGSKDAPTKAEPNRKQVWPAGTLVCESFEEFIDNAFAASAANKQVLQHELSTLWRSVEGDLDKLPKQATVGKRFWYDGNVVRLNREFVPGTTGNRLLAAAKSAVDTSEILRKAGQDMSAEQFAARSGFTPSDLAKIVDYIRKIENGEIEVETIED